MGVVISYLKLIRYLNVAIIIATVFISTIFLSHFTDYLQVSVVAFCLAISAAAGNVINDLFDQEIDKVNKPDKVIVGKDVSIKNAKLFYFILVLISVLPSLFLGWESTLSFTIINALLYLYSWKLKKSYLVGNVLVAGLSATAIWIPHFLLQGWIFAFERDEVAVFTVFAFIVSWVREMVKDAEDIEGDRSMGCITFAIKHGAIGVKIFSFTLLLFVAWYTLALADNWYWYFAVIPMEVLFLVFLYRAKFANDFGKVSKLAKVLMVVGLLSMMFK